MGINILEPLKTRPRLIHPSLKQKSEKNWTVKEQNKAYMYKLFAHFTFYFDKIKIIMTLAQKLLIKHIRQ